MIISHNRTRLLISCLAFSVLAHILFFYALRMFATYDFSGPVNPAMGVMFEMPREPEVRTPHKDRSETPEAVSKNISESTDKKRVQPITPQPTRTAPAEVEDPAIDPEEAARILRKKPGKGRKFVPRLTPDMSPRPVFVPTPIEPDIASPIEPDSNVPPPVSLVAISEFLPAKGEKLTYAISVMGLPVGNAELEAVHEDNEVKITLNVKSNLAVSNIFPVDDLIETRHIDGQFIITRVKQQEGSFAGDTGFTINLRKRRVSWDDYLKNTTMQLTVPNAEVLDTLSGFYYLRNRQLEVGKPETLNIFDSEVYAEVPVEVLRRETIRLPNFKKVDTLVLRPLQKTAGIFRRTGDIFIWVTDDANKVPVRIVTSVPLGTVTAELISAESVHQQNSVEIKK